MFNWEAIGAIGETLGAIGVLVTIVYFAIQLRKTQLSVEAMSMIAVQDGAQFAEKFEHENADLILKADRGEALSEKEKFLLSKVFGARLVVALGAYQRGVALGGDRAELIKQTGVLLRSHPSYISAWRSFTLYEFPEEWVEGINRELESR